MMTGRELIIYILENNLEDKLIFEDGRFLGFMTEMEAAIKFDVGLPTIQAWYKLGFLKGIIINDKILIPANAENPKERHIDD